MSRWFNNCKVQFEKEHNTTYIYYTLFKTPSPSWSQSGIPEAINGGLGPTLRRRRRRRKGWESEALSSGEKKRRPLVNMRKWQRTLIRVFPFHFWMGLFVENFVHFVGLLLLLYGPILIFWWPKIFFVINVTQRNNTIILQYLHYQ